MVTDTVTVGARTVSDDEPCARRHRVHTVREERKKERIISLSGRLWRVALQGFRSDSSGMDTTTEQQRQQGSSVGGKALVACCLLLLQISQLEQHGR